MAPRTIIEQTKHILPNLRNLAQSGLSASYDTDADVLYVSFGKPQEADDAEMNNQDVIIRRRGEKVVGLTFLNASRFQ